MTELDSEQHGCGSPARLRWSPPRPSTGAFYRFDEVAVRRGAGSPPATRSKAGRPRSSRPDGSRPAGDRRRADREDRRRAGAGARLESADLEISGTLTVESGAKIDVSGLYNGNPPAVTGPDGAGGNHGGVRRQQARHRRHHLRQRLPADPARRQGLPLCLTTTIRTGAAASSTSRPAPWRCKASCWPTAELLRPTASRQAAGGTVRGQGRACFRAPARSRRVGGTVTYHRHLPATTRAAAAAAGWRST